MKEVAAAIIYDSDKVLITRRDLNQKMAGFWEFPGGKVEKGETPQQCIEIELKEELNIKTRAADVIFESEYIYDHGAFKILAIEVNIISGYIKLNVHDKYMWATFKKLKDYKFLPADISIVEFLLRKFN